MEVSNNLANEFLPQKDQHTLTAAASEQLIREFLDRMDQLNQVAIGERIHLGHIGQEPAPNTVDGEVPANSQGGLCEEKLKRGDIVDFMVVATFGQALGFLTIHRRCVWAS